MSRQGGSVQPYPVLSLSVVLKTLSNPPGTFFASSLISSHVPSSAAAPLLWYNPSMSNQHYSTDVHPARATYDERMRAEQEAFLLAFPHSRSIAQAAASAGVTFGAVYQWRVDNALGFLERFRLAQAARADYLEELAQKRVENPSFNGRIGSDVLLMGLLNANYPEKWRPNVTVTHDLGARVLATLQQLQAQDRERRLGYMPRASELLPPSIVEQAPATGSVAPG